MVAYLYADFDGSSMDYYAIFYIPLEFTSKSGVIMFSYLTRNGGNLTVKACGGDDGTTVFEANSEEFYFYSAVVSYVCNGPSMVSLYTHMLIIEINLPDKASTVTSITKSLICIMISKMYIDIAN